MERETTLTRMLRIAHYERLLQRLQNVISDESSTAEALLRARGLAEALSAYYASDVWKRDFAADEAGLLPSALKRGVLSEDGIYLALESYRERLEEQAGAENF